MDTKVLRKKNQLRVWEIIIVFRKVEGNFLKIELKSLKNDYQKSLKPCVGGKIKLFYQK